VETSSSVEHGVARLPTGSLEFIGDPANEFPLTDLCGFGARRNPKRGFVLVSKVLGKHWSVSVTRGTSPHRCHSLQSMTFMQRL